MLSALPDNSLLGADGLPRFGYFASPVTQLNLPQFTYYNGMDKPASALAKYLHYKQFQFISISHADWQIGVAIADIRYAASAFCYFFDRSNNRLDEIELLKPFSLGVNMSHSPSSGTASRTKAARRSSPALVASLGRTGVTTRTSAPSVRLRVTASDSKNHFIKYSLEMRRPRCSIMM